MSSITKMLIAIITAMNLTTVSALAAPNKAVYDFSDVLIASFMNSYEDKTDVLYASLDGINFEELTTAYQDATPHSTASDESIDPGHYTIGDPSIVYYNGNFWMLSGMQKHDGKFWPSIGVSQDGIHWSHPEVNGFNDGSWGGISLNVPAPGCDTVAPEWFLDNNGQLYILFSAGTFGAFHGAPQQDNMRPYIVKVNTLYNDGWDQRDPKLPYLKLSTGVAQQIPLGEEDRIDGSMYQEGLSYYMVIKRSGQVNEIWHTNNINDVHSWSRIVDHVAFGFEGASLVKHNGQYLLYADKLVDTATGYEDGTTGTFVFRANNPAGPWPEVGERITTYAKNGAVLPNRHGTIKQVKSRDEKSKVYKLWTL